MTGRVVGALIGLGCLCPGSLAAANRDQHVVLISLDGFPAYLFRDPSTSVPNLRRLAREGVVADAMTVSNPSITWPNHTTLTTGVTPEKHGVLYNGLPARQGPGKPNRMDQWVEQPKLVRVPTLWDVAFQAGLTTAEMDWVAITKSKTVTWSWAEIVDPAAPLPREMLAAGVISPAELDLATTGKPNITWRDELWTRAACFAIERHQPNLTLFHLLTTDSVHHRFGPGSLASQSALALVDQHVGEVLRAIDASGARDRTTVIVTTDHGFKKVDQYVYANVILKHAGLLTTAGTTIAKCDAWAGTQGGIAFVYITDRARRAELLPKLKELFARAEGIDRVLDASAEANALGMPTPEQNDGMGELILYPKAGYALFGNAVGDLETGPSIDYGGTHGYPNTDPELDGIFLAAGAGIKKGVQLGRVRNLDVAPTIAHLLGIEMPPMDGKVMAEILTEK